MIALRAEVEELREALARAQDELARLRNERLQQALSGLLAVRANEFAATRSSERVVGGGLPRIRHRDTQWFGSLPAMIGLFWEIARLGDAGIDQLLRRVGDPNLDPGERGIICELLVYVPYKGVLEFLMTDHPDLEYSVDLEFLQYQAENLPTADVRPHARELNRLIALDGGGTDELRLLVTLALVHEIPESRQLLRRVQGSEEHAQAVLEAVNWLGTGRAREYLEDVSRTHRDRTLRDQAAAFLEEW